MGRTRDERGYPGFSGFVTKTKIFALLHAGVAVFGFHTFLASDMPGEVLLKEFSGYLSTEPAYYDGIETLNLTSANGNDGDLDDEGDDSPDAEAIAAEMSVLETEMSQKTAEQKTQKQNSDSDEPAGNDAGDLEFFGKRKGRLEKLQKQLADAKKAGSTAKKLGKKTGKGKYQKKFTETWRGIYHFAGYTEQVSQRIPGFLGSVLGTSTEHPNKYTPYSGAVRGILQAVPRTYGKGTFCPNQGRNHKRSMIIGGVVRKKQAAAVQNANGGASTMNENIIVRDQGQGEEIIGILLRQEKNNACNSSLGEFRNNRELHCHRYEIAD
jgi:hypothetical protein